MSRHVYLDNNATTSMHPAVIEEMLPFFRERFGNPSSIHWAGRRVKSAIEEARDRVANLVSCDPSEVVFTSCATESNNTAIKGIAAARRSKGNHIVTTTVEHQSVLTPCLYLEHQGYEVTCLDVDSDGMIDLQTLESSLSDKTIIISAMYANNETGTLFPVDGFGEIAARKGVYFHCDAAQAVGKVSVNFRESNISLMSLSGHKLSGPQGIGAIIVRKGVKLFPLLHGGPQERNRRGGTENVAGIVGLGKACDIARETMASEGSRLKGLRDRLEQGILEIVPDARINGHPLKRLPSTSNLSIPHVEPDSLLFSLDMAGIAASSGSACSSGAIKTSHVIRAMGLAEGTTMANIRFSLGRNNVEADIDYVLDIIPGIIHNLQHKPKIARHC